MPCLGLPGTLPFVTILAQKCIFSTLTCFNITLRHYLFFCFLKWIRDNQLKPHFSCVLQKLMSLIFDIGNYNRNQNLKNKQVKIVNGGVVVPGKSVLFSGLLHHGCFGIFFPQI